MGFKKVQQKVAGGLFDTLVLRPIGLADRWSQGKAWDPLDRVTGFISRAAGKALQPRGQDEGPHPLSRAMKLIDRCEGWVGVYGTWEIVDEKTVLRKVPECPFVPRLSGNPTFCKRLGLTMGRQALATAFPDKPIDFEILTTLSSGDPCCTYRLRLKTG